MTFEQALLAAVSSLGAVVIALAAAIVVLWRMQVADARRCERARRECEEDRLQLWQTIANLQPATCSKDDCPMRTTLPMPQKPHWLRKAQ